MSKSKKKSAFLNRSTFFMVLVEVPALIFLISVYSRRHLSTFSKISFIYTAENLPINFEFSRNFVFDSVDESPVVNVYLRSCVWLDCVEKKLSLTIWSVFEHIIAIVSLDTTRVLWACRKFKRAYTRAPTGRKRAQWLPADERLWKRKKRAVADRVL